MVYYRSSYLTINLKHNHNDCFTYIFFSFTDSLSVARNLVLEWEWFYPINVEFTSQVEASVRDFVIAEVIKFSEDMRDLDLSRPFCPDPTCSTLTLEFRLSPNEQRLWCTFRLEDIK